MYRVLKVQNTFNEGVFKQRLKIVRYPGQIIGKTKETLIADKSKDTPKPGSQQIESTTAGVNQGGTPISEANATDAIMRGLPSPGLPGVLSNFTGAIGGLGGQVTNLLTQVSGAVTRGLNGLAGANSVFGGSIPGGVDQLASGIRLKASGLINSVQSGAASVVQAGKTLESVFSINGTASSLASDITNKATAAASLISVKGSGIGQGASILIDKSASIISSHSSNDTVSATDLIKTTAQLPTDITLITGKIKDLSSSVLSSVSALGQSDASKIISNIGNKITSVTSGTPADPTAIAAKFGINASQLSGLGGNIQSKVLAQLDSLSKNIPEDTDLSIATARGLALNYVSSDKLKNIPATTSYLTAPKPEVDQKFLAEITKTGGPQALANAFGVSDVKNISAELLPTESVKSLLTQVSNGIKNPLTELSGNLNLPDISSLGSKLTGAQGLLKSVSPSLGSVESNLTSIASKVGNTGAEVRSLASSVSGKFGSITAGKSPLDKLFNG